MARPVRWILALAAAAAAQPGRDIRYAESANGLVYAFVFGSRDTCRVIRRPAAPSGARDVDRRRINAEWRGAPGETIVAEFSFGRYGRPVHIVPSNDGRFVVAFANRAPDGSAPAQDRIHHLSEREYAPGLDYSKLPVEAEPAWPELPRALPRKGKPAEPPPPGLLNYAFVTAQADDERLLVARWTEGPDGPVGEIVCFAVKFDDGVVSLPDDDTLARLAAHEEPLFRAGAAWALGRGGAKSSTARLRAVLGKAQTGVERAEIARALVRCGDDGARKTLRGLLAAAHEPGARRAAAAALVSLPPEAVDAEALAEAIADPDAETARLARLALARVGAPGLPALVRASRSSKPERRAAAAAVLGRIDAAGAEKRLLAMVLDSDDAVQKAAAVALTSPPRSILPEHHADYARALDACRRSRNERASFLLCVLAAHARIRHEKVLEALVELAPVQEKAIWALAKLTKEDLKTPDDCKRWWKSR